MGGSEVGVRRSACRWGGVGVKVGAGAGGWCVRWGGVGVGDWCWSWSAVGRCWSWILGLNVGLVLKLVAGFGGKAWLELRVELELRAVIGGGTGFGNAV